MEERQRNRAGRFERVEDEPEMVEEARLRAMKAPRPRYCRVYVRARLAEALPEIMAKLITKAKAGSIPHIALLLKTAGLDNRDELVPPALKRPEKSLAAVLMEGWEREKAK